MKDVDIVIKSFNRPWLLGICLESIAEHVDRSRVRVVVADDGTEATLWAEAKRRYGPLADAWVHSVEGERKWPLCRAGRFSEVVPTCGKTWNEAHAAGEAPTMLLLEDDIRLTRPPGVDACRRALSDAPDLLCLIGLRERHAMEVGTGPVGHGPGEGDASVDVGSESFLVRRHAVWPWSFAGHFYRRADWDRLGPWPEGVATGPMEGFVQRRLTELGWMPRPYGVANDPFCRSDSQTSVRTDHPSTYRGRFAHVDACNAAWLAGEFCPSYADARGPMQLHYPPDLRQVNYTAEGSPEAVDA